MRDEDLTYLIKCGKLTPREFRTIKVWKSTWRKIRLLAALTDKSMVAVIDESIEKALENAKQENK